MIDPATLFVLGVILILIDHEIPFSFLLVKNRVILFAFCLAIDCRQFWKNSLLCFRRLARRNAFEPHYYLPPSWRFRAKLFSFWKEATASFSFTQEDVLFNASFALTFSS